MQVWEQTWQENVSWGWSGKSKEDEGLNHRMQLLNKCVSWVCRAGKDCVCFILFTYLWKTDALLSLPRLCPESPTSTSAVEICRDFNCVQVNTESHCREVCFLDISSLFQIDEFRPDRRHRRNPVGHVLPRHGWHLPLFLLCHFSGRGKWRGRHKERPNQIANDGKNC